MMIGSWDISQANAKQWNVTFGNHSVKNESEWMPGAARPILCGNRVGFKELSVSLLVSGNSRKEILARHSLILSKLLEPTELQLDGYGNRFIGILTKHSFKESSMKRFHLLTLQFDCYEFGAQANGSPYTETFSGETSFTVTGRGNITGPATVEITPQIGVASLEITGLCRDPYTGEDLPVTIENLTTGQTVTLDGETGLFTEAGELKADIEIWEVPTLLPGANTITLSSDRMDFTIKHYPRFM